MRKLIVTAAVGAFALVGFAAAPGASACNNTADHSGNAMANPGTGGMIYYSTDSGNSGATLDGSTGYIEVREANGGYEVDGRESGNRVWGNANTANPAGVCVNDLP